MPGKLSPAARPMYLIAELQVRDTAKLRRYAAEVQPLMQAHGGEIIAMSAAGATAAAPSSLDRDPRRSPRRRTP